MSTAARSHGKSVDDEEIRRLAERLSAMSLNLPVTGTSPSLPTSRTAHVSCFSFLRSIFSPSRRSNGRQLRATVRPVGTAQSDPGVVTVTQQAQSDVVDGPDVTLSSIAEEAPLKSSIVVPPRDKAGLIEARGSGDADDLLNGLSPSELQKIYDNSVKRAEKAALPPGGLFKGFKDTRSVLSFLHECERTPSWDIGYGPSAAFFQGIYLERCLSDVIRQTVVDGVDRRLLQQGYSSYRKAVRRAGCIRSELVERFLSIESRRILIDRWERLSWDTKRETFDQFYLRFDYTRMAVDSQRHVPLTTDDVSDRLFGSFPDDVCEDILHRYGNAPSLEQLVEYGRRHNAVLVRRAARAGRLSRQAAVDVMDGDPVVTMPVDSAMNTSEAAAQTNCRLFMSNLSYDVSEKQVLDALRSILKLSGVSPVSVRLFRDHNRPGRNRGIGILEFRDPSSATNALSSINGKAVLGRTLRVRRDVPGAKRRRVDSGQNSGVAAQDASVPSTSSGVSTSPTMPTMPVDTSLLQDVVSPNAKGSQTPTVLPTSVCLTDDPPKQVNAVPSSSESHFKKNDESEKGAEIHLDQLARTANLSRQSTGMLTDILAAVQLPDGSSHSLRWLLDSGAVEHLVSATVGNLLSGAPRVHLDHPVTLLFANGQQQRVDCARRVTLRIGSDCYTTTVLIVDGLSLPGVLSLHKLARDVGSLSWFMCADGSELLQLGSANVLRLCSESSIPSRLPVFLTLADSDNVTVPTPMLDSSKLPSGQHQLSSELEEGEEERAEIKLDYVLDGGGCNRARVSLPWLSSERPSSTDPGLGRRAAIARDVATCQRLREMGGSWYDDFEKELQDMEAKGYIRPLTPAEVREDFPVASTVLALRPGHKTQPVRITIDARGINARLDSGDVSMLRKALKAILLRSRMAPFVAFEDVVRAFPQLLLHIPDTVSLNFRSNNRYWRCLRLPFGLTCSPACLCIALQDIRSILIKDYGSPVEAYYPYMDDLLYTAWLKSVLISRRDRGSQLLLSQANMHCQPAKSIELSDPTFMGRPDNPNGDRVIGQSSSLVQLGYVWCIDEDSITIQIPKVGQSPLTTRRLSFKQLSKLYDPLGLYIEVVARQRLLLSLISGSTHSWDSMDVSTKLAQAVQSFLPSSLPHQPRFCDLREGLVIFCDAAGSGCICCDARSVADGRRLLAYQATLNAKWSVARLELCALVAGVKLLEEILEQRDVVLDGHNTISGIWICTDSQLNAWRVKRDPRLDEKYLPPFERRRVSLLRRPFFEVVCLR